MNSFSEEDAQTIAQKFIDAMDKKECEWKFVRAEKCRIFKRKWNVVYQVFSSDGTQQEDPALVVVNEMDKSASVFPGL